MLELDATSGSAVELKAVETNLVAANFAAEKDAAQKRKGAAAGPYVNHSYQPGLSFQR